MRTNFRRLGRTSHVEEVRPLTSPHELPSSSIVIIVRPVRLGLPDEPVDLLREVRPHGIHHVLIAGTRDGRAGRVRSLSGARPLREI